MSQVDQKRSFNKLKHELEPFRVILLQLNALLVWEKNFYPGIIFGAVTLFYITLWTLELSMITLLSLIALTGVIFDYGFPTMARLCLSGTQWDGTQEEEFCDIIEKICELRTQIFNWYDFLFKEPKSTMFVIIVSISLLLLAWIGAVVNNLMLMYLVTLCAAMTPGIREKQLYKNVSNHAGGLINKKIKELSGKKME